MVMNDTPPEPPPEPTVALDFQRREPTQMIDRARDLREQLSRRRSVRAFSRDPIPLQAVRDAIMAASSAPSGANKQPWTFVLVTDPVLKRRIRVGVEEKERAFYGGRAPKEWIDDLEPFGTGPDKSYLEDAPALIVVMAQASGGQGDQHYYVKESVGIATGMLIAALHLSGLATLTHTPSPMKFLREILGRPDNERPFVLLPVGYPADDCRVPAIARKAASEVLIEHAPAVHGCGDGG